MTGIPPTKVVLLRHGAHADDHLCSGRHHDPPLSDHGRRQAAEARDRLGVEFDYLVTSPLLRARETAAFWPQRPAVDDRLAERDFGSWEGHPWQTLWATVPAVLTQDAAAYAGWSPPGGESLDGVAARVVTAVTEAAQRFPGGTVLAVTHAGPLRLAVTRLVGMPDRQSFALAAPYGGAAVLATDDRMGGWILEQLSA